jgi:hypothetical protein
MGVLKPNRARITVAWVCLLAAVALYAPLGAAAWSAYGIACCTGDRCPIKAHHHQKKQAAPHSDMDCGHNMGEMMNCSMACCDSSEKPLVTAVAFVLPDLQVENSSDAVVGVTEVKQVVAIARCVAPLSPPPQVSAR